MSAASATMGRSQNRRGAPSGASNTPGGYIARAVQTVFANDTVKTFARVTGLSFGTANKKVYGQRPLTADELAALLRTEQGFEFLTLIMADAQPKWWSLCSAYMDAREAQRLQAEARAKLRRAVRGALNADASLSAALAHADALLVSDPDFMRAHVDALRATHGVPDRTVAQAATKGTGK